MSSSKVFTDYQEFESKSPRNSYDLSKRVYGTYQYGALYPIATFEMNYGESIELDIESLLNFFPMTWPVQTPSRVHYYVFYDRWRNCMKSWKDFRFNNKKVVHPFILQPASNKEFWKTGSLVDHLGIPTTLTSKPFEVSFYPVPYRNLLRFDNGCGFGIWDYGFVSSMLSDLSQNIFLYRSSISSEAPSDGAVFVQSSPLSFSELSLLSYARYNAGFSDVCTIIIYGLQSLSRESIVPIAFRERSDFSTSEIGFSGSVVDWKFRNLQSGTIDVISDYFELVSAISRVYSFESYGFGLLVKKDLYSAQDALPGNPWSGTLIYSQTFGTQVDITTDGISNPFAGTIDNPPQVPLNALPFRTYERVYNCYFRDEKVDPFVKDGEVQYNEFQTTDADGADTTDYHLFFRNWQKDFLTSATPTPQQGVAPLVGINYRGDMEFMNEDGTIAKIRPTLAADGTTVTGISGTIENGTPEALRSAMDLVSMGISIQDFRNVNALQRWLENNIRRGLRYRDQVLANTGIPIKFDELDLPEFIGGFSRPVQVSQVTQMTPSTGETNALGSRAGQASAFGGSKHKIRHYCDEAGCVMVIMCVTPDPVYTQLLPKMFLKSDPLSYYNEQFGHIGPQPISYREVAPVQCANFGFDLNKTFGYQRAWYDLISSTDDAHGQFRLPAMRDMLMQRTFSGVPVLGRDFVTIDPAQINDVFAYRNPDPDAQEDVIAGQTYIQCYIKRPIPRFGQPRLEA